MIAWFESGDHTSQSLHTTNMLLAAQWLYLNWQKPSTVVTDTEWTPLVDNWPIRITWTKFGMSQWILHVVRFLFFVCFPLTGLALKLNLSYPWPLASGRWDFQNCLQLNFRVLCLEVYLDTVVWLELVISVQCWETRNTWKQIAEKFLKEVTIMKFKIQSFLVHQCPFFPFSQYVVYIWGFIPTCKFLPFCPSFSSVLYYFGNTIPRRKKM